MQSWGGAFQDAQREAYFKPFQELSGITVVESEGPDLSKIKAMVDTGNVEQDVVQLDRSDVILLEKQGDLLGTDRLLALRRRQHRRRAAVQVLRRHAPLFHRHWLSQRRLPRGSAGASRFLESGRRFRATVDRGREWWRNPVPRVRLHRQRHARKTRSTRWTSTKPTSTSPRSSPT